MSSVSDEQPMAENPQGSSAQHASAVCAAETPHPTSSQTEGEYTGLIEPVRVASLYEEIGGFLATIADLSKRLEALQQERDEWKRGYLMDGVCEIGAANPNVASYMDHWEPRAETAEADLAALQQKNITLKSAVEHEGERADVAEAQLEALRTDMETMRKALEFYAHPDNWLTRFKQQGGILRDAPAANLDGGALARSALSALMSALLTKGSDHGE